MFQLALNWRLLLLAFFDYDWFNLLAQTADDRQNDLPQWVSIWAANELLVYLLLSRLRFFISFTRATFSSSQIREKCQLTKKKPTAAVWAHYKRRLPAEFGDSRREVTVRERKGEQKKKEINVTDREDKCRFNIVTWQLAARINLVALASAPLTGTIIRQMLPCDRVQRRPVTHYRDRHRFLILKMILMAASVTLRQVVPLNLQTNGH